MKIFQKIKSPNGNRRIYILGVEVFSYQKKKTNKRTSLKIKGNLIKNTVKIPPKCPSFITIKGENNSVIFDSDCENVNLSISIYGNHNSVHIKKSCTIQGVVTIGVSDTYTENCTLCIGENTHINGMSVLMLEKGTKVSIGAECMFSDRVLLYASDTHSILHDGHLINRGKSITIGEHVWLGHDVKVLKNTIIPDNCIVGMGSIVTKQFKDTNCVIAGNPAKIVKQNINWDIRRPDVYEKMIEK